MDLRRWCRAALGLVALFPATVALLGQEAGLLPVRGNLEGAWRFAVDPEEAGEAAGWQGPAFDDSAWREVQVPGLWEPQGITEPRPGQPPTPRESLPWTDYDGAAWYRRTVIVPDAWRAVGQVRQSNVDTYLFLCLHLGTPVDASDSDFVVVDLEVPAGQAVGAGAHLFAVEADGGEFLAPLGFALNEPGLHRVWLPWERLSPTPWCTLGDGVLDRSRLVEFRSGGGGYSGREGERVEFTLAPPCLGRLGP